MNYQCVRRRCLSSSAITFRAKPIFPGADEAKRGEILFKSTKIILVFWLPMRGKQSTNKCSPPVTEKKCVNFLMLLSNSRPRKIPLALNGGRPQVAKDVIYSLGFIDGSGHKVFAQLNLIQTRLDGTRLSHPSVDKRSLC